MTDPSVEKPASAEELEYNNATNHKIPAPTILAQNNEELAQFYASFEQKDEEWKSHMDRLVTRKIDIKLLPMLGLMYLLNFLDRSNLAQARQGTLEEDLNMTGTDYNLATSILFVGYLLMQLPSNLLITRIRPSVFLGCAMAVWGLISGLQACLQSFGGLIACRFTLGIVEAPFFPGAVFLMSSWYRRPQLGLRIAIFYCGNAIAQMFGGLLGAGVLGNMHNAHGIAGWRWLFIIEGSITVGVSIVSAFILPNFPSSACKWLTPEQHAFAQWRVAVDSHESDDLGSVTVKDGLLMALRDYRLYVFLFLQHTSLLTQTFQYFFPAIVNSLGYGKIESLLLTAPVWFATFLVSLLVTYTSGRFHDHAWHIFTLLLISCLGNIIMISTLNTGARFFAMFLLPIGAYSAYEIIVAWVANSFPRPTVKRSATVAICNMFGNTATIYGAYMYTDGPRYVAGGAAVAGVCVVVAVTALCIRVILRRQNSQLEKSENEKIASGIDPLTINAYGFRYIL
ncbi:major facilitator superfamily domain-containing protein [Myxozyma melibiosi]|uniref:Major facilitator superfamily domain-containing protein n=1 Tax=Myxozyma melibiosi TaxID=54550 RepID=A0ABR1F5Z7_9ASCO